MSMFEYHSSSVCYHLTLYEYRAALVGDGRHTAAIGLKVGQDIVSLLVALLPCFEVCCYYYIYIITVTMFSLNVFMVHEYI